MTTGSERIGDGSLEFRVVPNNPETRFLRICFSIPFVGLSACALALFAAGAMGQEEALFTALFLTLGGGVVMWNVQQDGRGSAGMDSSGLMVKTRGSTYTYPWTDVADVVLTSFAERGAWGRFLTRITVWREGEPFVELKLKRTLRQGLSPGRYGTSIKGIPLIGGDRVALFVREPESFVRSAKSYLEAQRHTSSTTA